MTLTQKIIIIAMCVLGTLIMRALPFLVFSSKKPTPKIIKYLGHFSADNKHGNSGTAGNFSRVKLCFHTSRAER